MASAVYSNKILDTLAQTSLRIECILALTGSVLLLMMSVQED